MITKRDNKADLSEQQKAFAEHYVFTTNMDAIAAIELAGYTYSAKSEHDNKHNKKLKAHSLLCNKKVVKHIQRLIDEVNSSLTIDRFYVINKLKELVESGSESSQLKALELLGKHIHMFQEEQKITYTEDPAMIAQEAYKIRSSGKVLKINKSEDGEDEEDEEGAAC
jgi:phage terminase small subunit